MTTLLISVLLPLLLTIKKPVYAFGGPQDGSVQWERSGKVQNCVH